MLWTILAVLLALWLFGVIGSFGGSLIHLMLVAAVAVVAFQFLNGRRRQV